LTAVDIEPQEDTLYGRYLIFALSEEAFGIEIQYVTEIIGIQQIHHLPETPNYIKGIINLRGKIIPVIDMRLKFHKEEISYTDRTCIVVIETRQVLAGLIVDRVTEVMTIEDGDIVPPPDSKTGMKNRYISGIGKVDGEVKLLLDCEKLFNDEETEIYNSIQDGGNKDETEIKKKL
jgi:purine-binding chemotaxis protein CheW